MRIRGVPTLWHSSVGTRPPLGMKAYRLRAMALTHHTGQGERLRGRRLQGGMRQPPMASWRCPYAVALEVPALSALVPDPLAADQWHTLIPNCGRDTVQMMYCSSGSLRGGRLVLGGMLMDTAAGMTSSPLGGG